MSLQAVSSTTAPTIEERWIGTVDIFDGLFTIGWDIADAYGDGYIYVVVAGKELFRREWNRFNSTGSATLYPAGLLKVVLNWQLQAGQRLARYAYKL